MKKPFVIGVTGGFGTGKSTVAAMFKKKGAQLLDADKIAHDAILPGRAVHKKIISIFGAGILGRGEKIDRSKLGKAVFGNKKKLSLLNSVIHPEVIKEMKAILKKRTPARKFYVVDVPLLIESGFYNVVDMVIVVSADRKVQVKRCMKKWKLSAKDVGKRIRSQMPLSKKRRMADFIIDNNGSIDSTRKEVELIWRDLSNGRKT